MASRRMIDQILRTQISHSCSCFHSRLPPKGPAKDFHLLSLNHARRTPHRAASDRIHCPAPPPCMLKGGFRSRLTLAEARVRGRFPAQKKEFGLPVASYYLVAILQDRRSAPQGGLNVRQAAVVSFSRSGQVTLTESIRPPLPAIGLPTVENVCVRQV